MNNLLEAIKQFSETLYQATEIFIGNPFDLTEIDMSKIPSHCFFVSDIHIEKGTMYHVKDGDLKRGLYEFIEEYPDRVFRGKRL